LPVGRLVWLLVIALWTLEIHAALREDHFPVLKTKTASYTNVTVTTKADSYIFIMHSRGMGSVPVSDLPSDVLGKLGYNVTDTRAKSSSTPVVASAPRHESVSVTHASSKQLHIPIGKVLLTVFFVCLCIFLFFSYCLSLICEKAGSPGGLLVWIPILQWIPMVRAAAMGPGWYFFFYGPVVVSALAPCLTMDGKWPWAPLVLWTICSIGNLIGWVAWCFKIVYARDKHFIFAIMLLLPITNIVAFLYLAFSGSEPKGKPAAYKSMALETA